MVHHSPPAPTLQDQLALTIADQSPLLSIIEWICRSKGRLEHILTPPNGINLPGFLLDSLLGYVTGDDVYVESTHAYGRLRDVGLNRPILERIEEGKAIHILPLDYSSASNETGVGHWGAAVRLKSIDPARPGFVWLYVDTWNDTDSSGRSRDERFDQVGVYLREHGVIQAGDVYRNFPTFNQSDNECAASICYAVIAIAQHYQNTGDLVEFLPAGYSSQLIRKWMYIVLKTGETIAPNPDFGQLEAAFPPMPSPPPAANDTGVWDHVEGVNVIYWKTSLDAPEKVTILKRSLDDELVPFYTIRMADGREKQTVLQICGRWNSFLLAQVMPSL